MLHSNQFKVYAEEIDSILAKMDGPPAAFIAESFQSCGGQIIFPDTFLKHVYSRVRAAGGIVIADEVQVGFGRAGTHMWAFQTYGEDVIPDIVTIGRRLSISIQIIVISIFQPSQWAMDILLEL